MSVLQLLEKENKNLKEKKKCTFFCKKTQCSCFEVNIRKVILKK